MSFSKSVVVAALLAATVVTRAEDLGTVGTTYPIVEESAVTMIKNRLLEKQRTGEMQKLQDEAIKRSIHSALNRPPLVGIDTVTARTERLIDPTVYYPRAITDEEGRIIVPAGARINPLVYTGLHKRLVFFDGRDHDQVEAVHAMVKREHAKVKPILIAGPWFDLSKTWKTQVYYDQDGTLTQRFGIHAVPAVISQKGDKLLLQELPAEELR